MTADDRRPAPPPPVHPDLDTLADLHADALDRSTAERVGGHAAQCPQCRAVLSGLDAVRADLRRLPSPPMPAAVAARLDATLADLRRGGLDGTPDTRAATPRTGTAPAGTVTDLAAARRRRRRLVRGLGAAAAAVAVVGAGASVATLAVTGSGDNATDSAAGGGGGAAERSAVDAGKAPGAAALAIPSYDRDTLRSNLPQIAQQSAVSIITGRDDTGPAGAMADTGRRTACAGTIGGSTGELQAVQRIRYEGRMAYVFVFQSGGRRTAYVVSDDCGTSPALPAAVLDTVS